MNRLGWAEEEFKDIISSAVVDVSKVIDINSPPGTGKTRTTLKYVVEKGLSTVVTLPTHTAQENALTYIAEHMEEEKPRKLRMHVIDYAGVERYCIFYNIKSMMKFLDQFRDVDESYTEAVEKLLGMDTVVVQLLGTEENVDEFWIEIGKLLDQYVETGDSRQYYERVRELIAYKGQDYTCRNTCIVGLMFNMHRRRVYEALRDSKIITFRKKKYEELRRLKHVGKHVLLANPSLAVRDYKDVIEGRGNVEKVLCPRLLLNTKSVKTSKGRGAQYIFVKRSIILTPHSALDYVLGVLDKAHRQQGIPVRHNLMIDEYDVLVDAQIYKVYSLDTIRKLTAKLEEVLQGKVHVDVEIEGYFLELAEYAYKLLKDITKLIEESIATGKYHPLVNLTVEGALSEFKETTLRTNEEVIYKPLSPRPVHIKYFAGSDLLPRILNRQKVLEHYKHIDPNLSVRSREAWMTLSKVVQVRGGVPEIYVVKLTNELMVKQREATVSVGDVISTIVEYLSLLRTKPQFYVYYKVDNNAVSLANLDAQLYKLLQLRRAILLSATSVNWNLIVLGPRQFHTFSRLQALAEGAILSSILVLDSSETVYANRVEKRYVIRYRDYTPEARKHVEEAIDEWLEIDYSKVKLTDREDTIVKVSINHSDAKQYAKLIESRVVHMLKPFPTPLSENSQEAFKVLMEYVNFISWVKKRAEGGILVLAQNKKLAKALAEVVRAKPCYREVCDENITQVTHYSNDKLKIDITWFRSRAERGIDLPGKYTSMVVVGSPYPQPSTITPEVTEPSALTTQVSVLNRYYIVSTNKRNTHKISIAHIPLDLDSATASLAQSVGRGSRSAMRNNSRVVLYMPAFVRNKLLPYKPTWLNM